MKTGFGYRLCRGARATSSLVNARECHLYDVEMAHADGLCLVQARRLKEEEAHACGARDRVSPGEVAAETQHFGSSSPESRMVERLSIAYHA